MGPLYSSISTSRDPSLLVEPNPESNYVYEQPRSRFNIPSSNYSFYAQETSSQPFASQPYSSYPTSTQDPSLLAEPNPESNYVYEQPPSSQFNIPNPNYSFYAQEPSSQPFVSQIHSSYPTSGESRSIDEIAVVSQALNVEQTVQTLANFANETSFPNSTQGSNDFFDLGDVSNNSDFSLGEGLDEVTALFTNPDGFFPAEIVAAQEEKEQYNPFI